MEQIKYTSVDRIFSKLIRDLGVADTINESDIIEWAGEALEAIGAVSAYEEAVAFIEVKNHQCKLPSGLHSIIQVARNRNYTPEDKSCVCPSKIVEEIEDECGCGTCGGGCGCKGKDYVLLDCNGMPLVDHEIAYYRPYFDLQYEYYGWCNSKCHRNNYTPVRLSNHTFFNNIVCQEDDNKIYQNCSDEYTIVRGELLRFSFQEGSIALSYLRQAVDDKGYPMIPDHYSYVTAITKYITMKIMERDFYAGREGSQMRLQKADQDWQWYCGQAGNYAMMPKGIDQWQNIMEQRNYIIPRTQNYYSFFGKMSRPENRQWNDPDRRNYYRGY